MSSKAAEMLGHPPGVKFSPDDDELVEFFLLPRIRGEKAWFPGVVIIDDDTAANTHPMELLERHGLSGDDNAYFFVRTRDAAARQDRHCAGGGRWVSQRPVLKGACIGGQDIKWRRVNLNLQTSRGKSGGGSNGWVMHEYTLTDPPCPFLKICHVTFSGHGKDSKRVPDGELAVSNKRARVAADSGSWKTTTIHDQESPSVVAHASSTCQVYGSAAPAIDQGYGAYFPIDQGMSASNQQLLGGTYCLPANAMPYMGFQEIQDAQLQPMQSSAWSFPYEEQVPLTTEQHQLQPVAAHANEGISPTSNQQLLDGTYLPVEEQRLQNTTDHQVIQHAQVQPEESSFWDDFPSAEELFLDTNTAEPQHDGLDEEKMFWRSIRVDIDNIVV